MECNANRYYKARDSWECERLWYDEERRERNHSETNRGYYGYSQNNRDQYSHSSSRVRGSAHHRSFSRPYRGRSSKHRRGHGYRYSSSGYRKYNYNWKTNYTTVPRSSYKDRYYSKVAQHVGEERSDEKWVDQGEPEDFVSNDKQKVLDDILIHFGHVKEPAKKCCKSEGVKVDVKEQDVKEITREVCKLLRHSEAKHKDDGEVVSDATFVLTDDDDDNGEIKKVKLNSRRRCLAKKSCSMINVSMQSSGHKLKRSVSCSPRISEWKVSSLSPEILRFKKNYKVNPMDDKRFLLHNKVQFVSYGNYLKQFTSKLKPTNLSAKFESDSKPEIRDQQTRQERKRRRIICASDGCEASKMVDAIINRTQDLSAKKPLRDETNYKKVSSGKDSNLESTNQTAISNAYTEKNKVSKVKEMGKDKKMSEYKQRLKCINGSSCSKKSTPLYKEEKEAAIDKTAKTIASVASCSGHKTTDMKEDKKSNRAKKVKLIDTDVKKLIDKENHSSATGSLILPLSSQGETSDYKMEKPKKSAKLIACFGEDLDFVEEPARNVEQKPRKRKRSTSTASVFISQEVTRENKLKSPPGKEVMLKQKEKEKAKKSLVPSTDKELVIGLVDICDSRNKDLFPFSSWTTKLQENICVVISMERRLGRKSLGATKEIVKRRNSEKKLETLNQLKSLKGALSNDDQRREFCIDSLLEQKVDAKQINWNEIESKVKQLQETTLLLSSTENVLTDNPEMVTEDELNKLIGQASDKDTISLSITNEKNETHEMIIVSSESSIRDISECEKNVEEIKEEVDCNDEVTTEKPTVTVFENILISPGAETEAPLAITTDDATIIANVSVDCDSQSMEIFDTSVESKPKSGSCVYYFPCDIFLGALKFGNGDYLIVREFYNLKQYIVAEVNQNQVLELADFEKVFVNLSAMFLVLEAYYNPTLFDKFALDFDRRTEMSKVEETYERNLKYICVHLQKLLNTLNDKTVIDFARILKSILNLVEDNVAVHLSIMTKLLSKTVARTTAGCIFKRNLLNYLVVLYLVNSNAFMWSCEDYISQLNGKIVYDFLANADVWKQKMAEIDSKLKGDECVNEINIRRVLYNDDKSTTNLDIDSFKGKTILHNTASIIERYKELFGSTSTSASGSSVLPPKKRKEGFIVSDLLRGHNLPKIQVRSVAEMRMPSPSLNLNTQTSTEAIVSTSITPSLTVTTSNTTSNIVKIANTYVSIPMPSTTTISSQSSLNTASTPIVTPSMFKPNSGCTQASTTTQVSSSQISNGHNSSQASMSLTPTTSSSRVQLSAHTNVTKSGHHNYASYQQLNHISTTQVVSSNNHTVSQRPIQSTTTTSADRPYYQTPINQTYSQVNTKYNSARTNGEPTLETILATPITAPVYRSKVGHQNNVPCHEVNQVNTTPTPLMSNPRYSISYNNYQSNSMPNVGVSQSIATPAPVGSSSSEGRRNSNSQQYNLNNLTSASIGSIPCSAPLSAELKMAMMQRYRGILQRQQAQQVQRQHQQQQQLYNIAAPSAGSPQNGAFRVTTSSTLQKQPKATYSYSNGQLYVNYQQACQMGNATYVQESCRHPLPIGFNVPTNQRPPASSSSTSSQSSENSAHNLNVGHGQRLSADYNVSNSCQQATATPISKPRVITAQHRSKSSPTIVQNVDALNGQNLASTANPSNVPKSNVSWTSMHGSQNVPTIINQRPIVSNPSTSLAASTLETFKQPLVLVPTKLLSPLNGCKTRNNLPTYFSNDNPNYINLSPNTTHENVNCSRMVTSQNVNQDSPNGTNQCNRKNTAINNLKAQEADSQSRGPTEVNYPRSENVTINSLAHHPLTYHYNIALSSNNTRWNRGQTALNVAPTVAALPEYNPHVSVNSSCTNSNRIAPSGSAPVQLENTARKSVLETSSTHNLGNTTTCSSFNNNRLLLSMPSLEVCDSTSLTEGNVVDNQQQQQSSLQNRNVCPFQESSSSAEETQEVPTSSISPSGEPESSKRSPDSTRESPCQVFQGFLDSVACLIKGSNKEEKEKMLIALNTLKGTADKNSVVDLTEDFESEVKQEIKEENNND